MTWGARGCKHGSPPRGPKRAQAFKSGIKTQPVIKVKLKLPVGTEPLNSDLKTRLKAALAGRDDIDVGQFKLVGLKEIREEAGDAWARIKVRVFTAAGQLIERELTPKDVVLQAGDGFLIVLADPALIVTDRLDEIAERLREFFLGSPETQAMKVQTGTVKLAADALTALGETQAPAASAAPARAEREPGRIPPASAAKPEDQSDGALSVWFRPVWDGREQQIMGNASRPKVWVGGRALDGRRVAETRMAPVDQAALDHLAQTSGFEALMRSIRAKKPTQISLSIHAETWASREDRAQILSRFEDLPETARSAFLVRFDGMDDNATRTAALKELAKTGVGLMVEVPFGDIELDEFADLDVRLFGWRCKPPSNQNSAGLMDHDMSALKRFVDAAAQLGADTYLQDVRDLYVLKNARDSGIRYFSGQAVISDRQKPAPAQPLSMVDIYRTHKAA